MKFRRDISFLVPEIITDQQTIETTSPRLIVAPPILQKLFILLETHTHTHTQKKTNMSPSKSSGLSAVAKGGASTAGTERLKTMIISLTAMMVLLDHGCQGAHGMTRPHQPSFNYRDRGKSYWTR